MTRKLSDIIKGRPALQPFLEKLHLSLLRAMGIGTGGNAETGGEKVALGYVKRKVGNGPRPVLFDVGANVGSYTKLLSETFPNADVFAFEPSPETFLTLCERCPSAKTFRLALGDRKESTLLYTNTNNRALASMYKRNLQGKHALNETEEIEVDTIDAFCSKNEIAQIDLLKLDVEGNELKCLRGAERMLETNRVRFIQFEFGGCDIDSRTFFKDFYNLLKDKYTLSRIMQNGLYEIKNYSETHELFVTTNYLAERKQS